MSRHYAGYLSPAELDREDLVRTVDCPVCERPAGAKCYYPHVGMVSHTGRYRVAAEAGLVPALPGVVAGAAQ